MTSKPSARGRAAQPLIDTLEFARTGGSLEGTQAPTDFPRLLDLLADDAGRIDWRLSGERQPRPEGGADTFLRLHLQGTVSPACTRCLRPVASSFADERLYKLAATETQAEREDAETDDYDVMATSERFDVMEFVEDEVILALPIAPRHEDCQLPAELPEPSPELADERPNPFAALAALKTRRDPDGGAAE